MKAWRFAGAGAFVLIGLLLFATALFLIGERRNLFTRRFPVYAEFTRLAGLQIGAPVRVSGMGAGEVKEIDLPPGPGSRFRVRLEIREDLHQLVRTDSVASLQTEGLVGGMFVQVSVGTAKAPRAPADSTIQSRDPFEMADMLQQASDTMRLVADTVESLRGDVERAVSEVAMTAEDAHALMESLGPDIESAVHNGQRISADASLLLQHLREGRGTAGQLLTDDKLYRDITDVAHKARDIADNVRQVTEDARRTLDDMRQKGGQASGLVTNMQQTVSQANEALGDLADNMEALKRNFLFRGFFKNRGYFDLDAITPAEYREGALGAGEHKALRVWLGADVLFQPGGEQLSADGKARIDSAMAAFLPFLPAAPLVVEGYATEGLTTDQFQRSRARATAVREYVTSRFGLHPTATAAMPLGPAAPGSPTGNVWDGVALAVFVPREALRDRETLAPRR